LGTIRKIELTRSMMRSVWGLALSAAISSGFTATPVIAQTSDTNDEIIVTGTRTLDSQVRDFVGALARPPGGERTGRFEQDFCPVVIGATEAGAKAITARLRAVSAAVGLEVGKPNCVANALLIVADDKRKFIEALANKRPEFFGSLEPVQIRRLARSPGGAAAWQLVGKVNSRGMPITNSGEGVPMNRTIDPSSRLTAAARPVFEAAALVLERSSLQGLDATQVADYAAMRLLARTDPSRVAGTHAPTILNVLDAPMGTEVPLSLTTWDLGYLKGLYSSLDALQGGAQRAAIAREIVAEIKQAD
jgi:hypothetical protein